MLLLKATLILVVGTFACAALRRTSADARHSLWSWTFAALLLLPLLALAMPPLHLPMPEAVKRSVTRAPEPATSPTAPPAVAANIDAVAAPRADLPAETPAAEITSSPVGSVTLAPTLGGAWLLGSSVALAALAISLFRVRRLSRDAMRVTDNAWRTAAASVGARLGLRRPVRLLSSPHVSTPMAGGIWRPTVYLPVTAVAWDDEQRDVVLAHELAHLAARDPLRHLVARTALALYWFHPLAWLAARQAAAAREQACDETVLSLGTRPSSYARVLLELAESIQAPPRVLATLPMVHRSLLEARVMAILNGTRHPSRSHRGVIPVLGISALTLLLAAISPVAAPMPNEARWVEISPGADIRLAAPTPAAVASTRPHLPEPAGRQAESYRAGDCWGRFSDGESFAGSTLMAGGGTIVRERIGTVNDAHRVMLFTLGGIRLCVFGESVGPADSTDPPSRWIGRAKRVVLESSTGSATYSMLFTAGAPQPHWQVNGVTRDIDRAADDWRARMLLALDARWEATVLRGQQTSLRGEITSVRGQETSLRGEITSLRGEVTSMRGRITTIRGEETSMRGRITSIRGHETSLRGQITSARGAITSINASRYGSAEAERRIGEYERQIERIEREIRDYNADAKIAAIEKEIEAFDADRKVAEIEKQIDAFDLEGKVAAIERRIAELKVSEKIEHIEEEIDTLDADRRAAAIDKRLEQAGAQLKTAIAAIK